MHISSRVKLFRTYIKPLLSYGCDVLDLNENDLLELKRCEGNALKDIIGITRKCHTSPIYAALGMETTLESIKQYQMKFLQRAQNNKYVNEFLLESRAIVNNEGMIGQLIMKEGWKYNCNMNELNKGIEDKLSETNMTVIDRQWFNEEAQQVKVLLNLKNNYLKIFRLNQMLHYSTYGKSKIEQAITDRMKTWIKRS